MAETTNTAVLLLAHGSPDRVEDIPEFLLNVTGGRALPDAIIKEVQHRYALIGRSPLTEITLRQAAALERALGARVYAGMRNWRPYIGEAVAHMTADGVQRAIVICLAPQNSRTSIGLYKQALQLNGATAPFTIEFVDSWHDHPLLIRAFAERLGVGWQRACNENEAGDRLPVIFTAHSVPQRGISESGGEGDPYEQQAKQTAALVAKAGRLSSEDWRFAFQSQGMSGGQWLGPTVEETILQLKSARHGGVFIQPIGFVCDHVEVLYDIDIAFRQFATRHGMRLWRAESLNDSPTFIAALAEVARSRMFERRPAAVKISH